VEGFAVDGNSGGGDARGAADARRAVRGQRRFGGLIAARDALPAFRGTQDSVLRLGVGVTAGQPVYAHVHVGSDSQAVKFSSSTLERTLARGAEQARMMRWRSAR